MGAIEVPADNKLWGRRLNIRWSIFSGFPRRKYPFRLPHSRSTALTKRACEGQRDLGVGGGKASAIIGRLMKCWRENMLMSFRWRFSRVRYAKQHEYE